MFNIYPIQMYDMPYFIFYRLVLIPNNNNLMKYTYLISNTFQITPPCFLIYFDFSNFDLTALKNNANST